jgi:hypothetical protein
LELKLESILATLILSYDESFLKDHPGKEKVFFQWEKNTMRAMKSSKEVSFSTMFCCSTSDENILPVVIFTSGTGSVFQR